MGEGEQLLGIEPDRAAESRVEITPQEGPLELDLMGYEETARERLTDRGANLRKPRRSDQVRVDEPRQAAHRRRNRAARTEQCP